MGVRMDRDGAAGRRQGGAGPVLGGVGRALGAYPFLATEVALVAMLSLGAVALAVVGGATPLPVAEALLGVAALLGVVMLGEAVRDCYRLVTVDGWPASALLAVGAAIWRILEFLAVVAFVVVGAVTMSIVADPPPGSESEGGGMLAMVLVAYLVIEAVLVVVLAVMVTLRAGFTVVQRPAETAGDGEETS